LGSTLLEKPDIIYAYHPPATVGLPAAALSLITGAPFVYDIQDLWPDSVLHSGMVAESLIIHAISAWCRFVYRRASHIVVLSPGFKRVLRERGVPSAKISVVYNWADETPVVTARIGSDALSQDRFNILFAGTMGTGQALDAVLRVADRCAAMLPSVHFWLVGRGTETERLQRKAAEMQLSNVTFLPHQPHPALMRIMDTADALLVHLRDIPLYTVTIPSKTQEYLAAGRPIIMAVRGDAADLVTEAGAGINCEPENVDSITAAIAKLVTLDPEGRLAMGAAGLAYYRKHLCFRLGLDRFESIFESVVTANRRRRGHLVADHSPEEMN
jgi:glycosyltransferase involved in cell wall biosynthesis